MDRYKISNSRLATDVEGIFRLSGSEKRIKELREAFNSPDRYGKGLDWTGYTVHDAANILRRYFNQLPEPIIPLEFYDRFRDPLRNHQSQAVGHMDQQSPSEGDFDAAVTIRVYQNLITELPPLNRQLLLYILDLLAVFASKSDLNKMTTMNLAAIFQPGILSHPAHDMAPPEYRLSQDVLIFLIENQDHFLIGMQGTAADEKTVQEVESGPPTPAVSRPTKTLEGRSSSNASKYSGVRRSVSVSSRHSKHSVAQSPMTPSFHGANSPLGTPVSGGVHRSNTVPSNRSPMTPHGSRFQRDQHLPSRSSSPSATPFETPMEMPGAYPFGTESQRNSNGSAQRYPSVGESVPVSEEPTPVAEPQAMLMSADDAPKQPGVAKAEPITTPLATPVVAPTPPNPETMSTPAPQLRANTVPIQQMPPGMSSQETSPPSATSSSSRGLAALLGVNKSPQSESDRPKPKKLQKKRQPGSAIPSTNSSTQSLGDSAPSATAAEDASIAPSTASNAPLLASQHTPTTKHAQTFLYSADNTPTKPPPPGNTTLQPEPPMSPTHSYRSRSEFTEGELEDVEPLDHSTAAGMAGLQPSDAAEYAAEKERKRTFWGSRKKGESVSQGAGNAYLPTGNIEAQRSRSSVLSAGEKDQPRRSMNMERNTAAAGVTSDQDTDYKKNLSWVHRKLAERAEKKEEKDRLKEEAREEKRRAKSPPPSEYRNVSGSMMGGNSMQSLTAAATTSTTTTEGGVYNESSAKPSDASAPIAIPPRGKSMDFRSESTPRRSLDPGSRDIGPSGSPLGSPRFPPRQSQDQGSRERQRSLLDIGEEAVLVGKNVATESPGLGPASGPPPGGIKED